MHVTATELITVQLHYSLSALQLCVGSWCPLWFRNSTFLMANQGPWLTRDYMSSDLLTYLALVALPGTYAPASIDHHVTDAHIPPLHVKVVVLKKTIN
jgi:hypothetical protein